MKHLTAKQLKHQWTPDGYCVLNEGQLGYQQYGVPPHYYRPVTQWEEDHNNNYNNNGL